MRDAADSAILRLAMVSGASLAGPTHVVPVRHDVFAGAQPETVPLDQAEADSMVTEVGRYRLHNETTSADSNEVLGALAASSTSSSVCTERGR